eukprot:3874139-Pleurochrysis_carterae.AAC.2
MAIEMVNSFSVSSNAERDCGRWSHGSEGGSAIHAPPETSVPVIDTRRERTTGVARPSLFESRRTTDSATASSRSTRDALRGVTHPMREQRRGERGRTGMGGGYNVRLVNGVGTKCVVGAEGECLVNERGV